MAWKRKCYVDDENDIRSPILTQSCSNEEFIPPAQSAKEQEVEYRLRQLADKNAKKLANNSRN
jgi:hypothetical protein